MNYDVFLRERVGLSIEYHGEREGLFSSKLLAAVIFLCSLEVACLSSQVKIQKESEVRLKIIGTRVDATEIVVYYCLRYVKKIQLRCAQLFCSEF
uniref:Uncharacterized protein n=1 Tax=Arundo donax TaxID=35708 RepID=A0A0A9DPC3_ARUDO